MWHKVAPALARDFTVVAADLRGYGDSSKPASTADHAPYSKRAMARDQVAVMRRLGFDRFSVVGHGRGARCAYRLAPDHPQHVRKLAVLDIIPTGDALSRANMSFAINFWVWFFLAQPADLPERIVGANPQMFLDYMLDGEIGPMTFAGARSTAVTFSPRRHRRRPAQNCGRSSRTN